MGHIQIPAENHRLFFFQLLQVFQEFLFPDHPVIQPRQPILGIGGIYRHHIKVRKLQGDHPAFLIVFLDPYPVSHRQRLPPGKNSRAGIPLFHRVIPVLAVARQFQGNLAFLQLALLDTENIRIRFLKKIHKPFAHTGSQAVNIPRYQFHIRPPFRNIRLFGCR